jgi:uncharacterized protein YbjQ (UPF0145 family)
MEAQVLSYASSIAEPFTWTPTEDETQGEVELYTCAWVPGAQVRAYFGPISSEIFLRDAEVIDRGREWAEAQWRVLEVLRHRARVKHANAVIGLELSLDPFARHGRHGGTGLYVHAVGTAARLEWP